MLFRSGNATINSVINSSSLVSTGFVNVATSVNSALISVGNSFRANSTQITISGIPLSANGTTGTSGQILASNGSTGAPYWTTVPSGTTVNVSDDTTTNSPLYLLYTATTSGTVSTVYVSSTKLNYNPSTGAINATEIGRAHV